VFTLALFVPSTSSSEFEAGRFPSLTAEEESTEEESTEEESTEEEAVEEETVDWKVCQLFSFSIADLTLARMCSLVARGAVGCSGVSFM